MTWQEYLIYGLLIWISIVGFVWAIVAGGSARQTECEHGREDIWCPECNGGNTNG